MRPPSEREAQLALIPELVEAPADVPAADGKPRIGRPPGSANRATVELRRFILARFTDPAQGLAACGLRSSLVETIARARVLAQQLGCKPVEALEFMRRCSEALAPYLHSKAPQEIAVSGRVATLSIGLGAPGEAGALAGAAAIEAFLRGDEAPANDAELDADVIDVTPNENGGNPPNSEGSHG